MFFVEEGDSGRWGVVSLMLHICKWCFVSCIDSTYNYFIINMFRQLFDGLYMTQNVLL